MDDFEMSDWLNSISRGLPLILMIRDFKILREDPGRTIKILKVSGKTPVAQLKKIIPRKHATIRNKNAGYGPAFHIKRVLLLILENLKFNSSVQLPVFVCIIWYLRSGFSITLRNDPVSGNSF